MNDEANADIVAKLRSRNNCLARDKEPPMDELLQPNMTLRRQGSKLK